VPHTPGFPVNVDGVGKLHAAFLNESRTRGRCLGSRTGNPGISLVFREMWGTQGPLVIGILNRGFSQPYESGLENLQPSLFANSDLPSIMQLGSKLNLSWSLCGCHEAKARCPENRCIVRVLRSRGSEQEIGMIQSIEGLGTQFKL
jgi:hypothetical protein